MSCQTLGSLESSLLEEVQMGKKVPGCGWGETSSMGFRQLEKPRGSSQSVIWELMGEVSGLSFPLAVLPWPDRFFGALEKRVFKMLNFVLVCLS